MAARLAVALGIASLAAGAGQAQQAERAVLVEVRNGVETEYLADADKARRELAAKVEMAARMACADAWTPRSTIYESIDYTVDWSSTEGRHAGQRKAIARNISVRCRLD